jgi:hypothetical protein
MSQDGVHDGLLDVGSSRLTMKSGSELDMEADVGAATIAGNVEVDGGSFINWNIGGPARIEGDLTLGPAATFRPIFAPDPAGALAVAGTAALSGTLTPGAQGTAQVGESFTALTAGAITGQFTGEGSHLFAHNTAEYYRLTYTQTEVDATVTIAKIQTPASAHIGSDIVITGSGFPAGDSIDLTLRDAAHTKFSLGTATADDSGAFTDEVTIPASASTGKATVFAHSTFVPNATSKLTLTQ